MTEADRGVFKDSADVPEIRVADAVELDARLRAADTPFVVRGLIKDWPLVDAGRRSSREARAYLLRHHRDIPSPSPSARVAATAGYSTMRQWR